MSFFKSLMLCFFYISLEIICNGSLIAFSTGNINKRNSHVHAGMVEVNGSKKCYSTRQQNVDAIYYNYARRLPGDTTV